tara:strand:+ start:6894 stop:7997 length:1104 start_codon:yes stop_codon:yes gene_type:complete
MSNSSDYVISNQAGSGFRTELNQVLGDIKSLNSGSTEPANKSAWMLWADTSNNLLKVRNGSNNAWITLGSLGTNMGMASLSASNVQNFTATIQTAGEIICNANTSLKMPVGSTSQRPLSPTQGDTRLNSTTKLLEAFSGTSWFSMFSGAHLEVYGTAGTYTYTPPEGRTQFLVICTGGGGGGASVDIHGTSGTGTNYWGASGGGAGGTAIRMYTLAELGASATAVVGRGGNALTGMGNGDNGVSSTFSPAGSGLNLTGELGTGSSIAYNGSTDAKAMSRPGWPGHGVNGEVNCSGEKAEFQTINNYTGATATGFDMVSMNSSGGGSFWGKGPGAGANGAWSNGGSTNGIPDAYGKAGKPGVIVVLSW